MKKLFTLAMIMVSVSALAKESISFTHYGHNGGSQSYYACDYAQSQAETYLQVFGARNIEVSCSGGINSWGMPQPVSVSADFDLPNLTTQASEKVEVEGDSSSPACGLNVQMIKAYLSVFKNIQVVKKSDSCAFTTSNYYYLLNITR